MQTDSFLVFPTGTGIKPSALNVVLQRFVRPTPPQTYETRSVYSGLAEPELTL